MIRKSVICLVCVIAAGVELKATEDFERSYTLVPGRHITIDNKMGDVKVTGYDGEEIKIAAHKEGPDQDAIKITDRNFGPAVELRPISSKFRSRETRVDFEVKVPKSNNTYSIKLISGSGKIEVNDLKGTLFVESFRGDVKIVNVTGNIFASSVSGKMDAEISQAQGQRWIKFDSKSGDINVTAPSDVGAHVLIKTSRNLKTDFSKLNIHKHRYGGSQVASGKLGSGTQRIEISSIYGSVSLMKKE